MLFWAFTKSLRFWVNRIDNIPDNFVLTASYGGKDDHLIKEYGLKYAEVFKNKDDAICSGLPIDSNDYWAMKPCISFALIDNFAKKE